MLFGYMGNNLFRLKWQCSIEEEGLPVRMRFVFAAFLISICGVFLGNAVGQEAMKPCAQQVILRLLKPTPGTRYALGDLAGAIAQRVGAFPVDKKTLDELLNAG